MHHGIPFLLEENSILQIPPRGAVGRRGAVVAEERQRGADRR